MLTFFSAIAKYMKLAKQKKALACNKKEIPQEVNQAVVVWKQNTYMYSLSSPVYQVEMLCDWYTGFKPSQLSCLGSSVGKGVA